MARHAAITRMATLLCPPGVREAFPEFSTDMELFRERLKDKSFIKTRFNLCFKCCTAAHAAQIEGVEGVTRQLVVVAGERRDVRSSRTCTSAKRPLAIQTGRDDSTSLIEWGGPGGHLVKEEP